MFKDRFLIQSPVAVSDGAGGYEVDWQDQFFAWGKRHAPRGIAGNLTGEKRQMQEVKVELKDVLGSGLKLGWSLYLDGRRYEVVAIGGEKGAAIEITTHTEATHAL